ncbi:adenosylcobinamide-GDP ribazoletransferase [Bacillus sp. FJAT-45037]|uniref:adenosylcobinamide-GDP ribazoletransferase n=1 Tax=Bacillus sp. FJAT-45037 TaxID=2011007 RepID=UPI000C239287|nr:adenosylcobinamide-GDP ribazoletransferase [Bacillus sp. FJAT-45037]
MRIKVKELGSGCLLAFQLLTTIPIRLSLQWNDQHARASVACYPLTGMVLGALLFFQAYLWMTYSSNSPLMLVAWLLTFSIIYSGGLHLDGWSDFSDAVFSRQSISRKLDIMKDSRVGAFGVLSLILLLGWRFLFMYEWLLQSKDLYLLFFIPFISRLLMGGQIILGTFAREDGMAVALKPAQTHLLKWVYGAWCMFLLLLLTAWSKELMISLIIVSLLFFVGWLIFCQKQIQGITGDTVGAGTEGSETFLWGVIWMLFSFDMV